MKCTIQKKTNAIFGSLALISSVFVVFIVINMKEFSEDAKNAAALQENFRVVKELQLKVGDVWQFLTDACLTKDESVVRDEAKPSLERAFQCVDRLLETNRGRPERVQTLELVKRNLESAYRIGTKMFNAYGIDWKQGNLVMKEYDTVCDKLISSVQSLADDLQKEDVASSVEMQEMSSSATNMSLLLALLAMSFLVVGFVLFHRTVRPINNLVTGAKAVAAGDFSSTVDVRTNDEIGELGRAFNAMVSNVKGLMDDVRKEKVNVERMAASTEEQRTYLSTSVESLLKAMERFSQGDLTVKMKSDEKDDIGKLFTGFNRAVENVRAMLQWVAEAVSATSSAAAQISSSTEELSSGAEQQSTQMGEIAAAMEEMNTTILENTETAVKTMEVTEKAHGAADQGRNVVEESVDGMKRIAQVTQRSADVVKTLGASSNQIGEITKVIEDIADQTNLLALNAAIEAARAGEQGRGFAVVADEVRKLAERTTKATKEIAVMIKAIQADTTEAVKSMGEATNEVAAGKTLAEKAGMALRQLQEISLTVKEMVGQIGSSTREQSKTSDMMAKSIDTISRVSHETTAGTLQIAKAGDDLHQLVTKLQELVSVFHLGTERSRYAVKGSGALVAEE